MKNEKFNIRKVELRDDPFVKKATTHISYEKPSKQNPFVSEELFIYGYDLFELAKKKDYGEVVFLLFFGRFPSENEHDFFKLLLIYFCNPGPRHNATRAAMTAGSGKTSSTHILPIALSILSGANQGAKEVQLAMQMFKKESNKCPLQFAESLVNNTDPQKGIDDNLVPGFGTFYNDTDILAKKIAVQLIEAKLETPTLNWANKLVSYIEPHGYGWLKTGVIAAALFDLGVNSLTGATLFQLFSSPGLLAHGIEKCNDSMFSMPFIEESNYIIEE